MGVELSIIIVNWNGRELLEQCLDSIIKSPPSVGYEIIVVDNASTDGSVEWLRSNQRRWKTGGANFQLIENAENMGFGRANNKAFALTNTPFLFLLNSDAEVRAGAIDGLIQSLRSDDQVGGIGPKLLNTDETLQPSVYRNPPTVWEILMTGLRLYYLVPRQLRGELLLGPYWDHNRRREVRMLSGAAILLRREVIGSVGGFDEEFHFYGEDIEWCLRIVRSGWKLLFEPGAEVVHHGGVTAVARWGAEEKSRTFVNALLRCYRKCLPRPHFVANCMAVCLVLSLEHVWRAIRGASTEDIDRLFGIHREHLKDALFHW